MPSDFKQVIKNNNFLKLWFSQILSQVAISIVNFALIARIFEQTASTVAVSFIWITYGLPALILGPIVGPLIDRTSKKKILFTSVFFQAAAVFCYLLVKDRIFPIYSIIFVYSVLSQFYSPAEAATIPSLVPKSDLASANSLYLLTFQIAILSGFAISGPVMAIFGDESPFIIGGAFLLLATLSVSRLPGTKDKQKPRSFDLYWRDLTFGYQYIRNHPFIYLPILFIMSFQTAFGIISAVFPSYINQVLSLAVRDASLIFVIPAGLGALTAALFAIPWMRTRFRKSQMIETGLFGGFVGLFAMGVLIPLLIAPWNLLTASIIAFVSGCSGILLIVPSYTLIQEQTPSTLRGRVFGSLSFLLTIAMVAPILLAATLTDILGPQMVAILLALFALSIFVISHRKKEEFIASAVVQDKLKS